MGIKLRSLARAIYHRLPINTKIKWKIREFLRPLILMLDGNKSVATVINNLLHMSGDTIKSVNGLNYTRERAIKNISEKMASHGLIFGIPEIWIAMPLYATGGSELVGLNIANAYRSIKPQTSAVFFITDRGVLPIFHEVPEHILLIDINDYLGKETDYRLKKDLLASLICSMQPAIFHNINSEVGWMLCGEEGKNLDVSTKFFASIFALQFSDKGLPNIGYAAYYLKRNIDYLDGLITDNNRFYENARDVFLLSSAQLEKIHVLYQPCRIPICEIKILSSDNLKNRPKFLWAGRLDNEKRIDLLFDIVRECPDVDFEIYGNKVIDQGNVIPNLSNLTYKGTFNNPIELIQDNSFDGFIFTSKWEGMPNILLEIGSLGLPIIAPTVGGIGELINLDTGYPLLEKPSAKDYIDSIEKIILFPLEAKDRAIKLQKIISERHGWNNFTKNLSEIPGYFWKQEKINVINYGLTQGMSFFAGKNILSTKPVISIIIPCFNQAKYLRQSVSSVINFTKVPYEIIIIDDGSSEGSTEALLEDINIFGAGLVKVIRQNNRGLSAARNVGIKEARGTYIQFLDADDMLSPGKLDVQFSHLLLRPDLDVSIGNFLLCDESRVVFSKPEEAISRFKLGLEDFLYSWERGFSIPIHCGLFRISIFDKTCFDEEQSAKEDWLFWSTLLVSGAKLGYIENHGAIYRQHESSMRSSYVRMGRAWIQASTKIDKLLGGDQPLFLDSAIVWFDKCYRQHPSYLKEISLINNSFKNDKKNNHENTNSKNKDFNNFHSKIKEPFTIASEILSLIKEEKPINLNIYDVSISIIIPVFNHFEHLQECITSALLQNVEEVVCINDASTDPRVSILLNELSEKNSILNIIQLDKNVGISEAQNIAVNKAKSEFLAFLDCDDILPENSIDVVKNYLSANSKIDYLFTDRLDIDSSGNIVRKAFYGGYDEIKFSSQDEIKNDLLKGMIASHLKIIRRSAYIEVGGCSKNYSGVQDWELALKLAEKHNFYYISSFLYMHRVHDESVTQSDKVAQFRKTNDVRRNFLKKQRILNKKSPRAVIRARQLPLKHNDLMSLKSYPGLIMLDARGELDISKLNFLREFNSYFDQILWSNPSVPMALIGYLHAEMVEIEEE